MNELVRATTLIGNKPLAGAYTSQTVIQTMAEMRRRRAWMIRLNVATCLAFLVAAALVLGSDGWSLLDTVYLLCIALTVPWAAMGFWHAVIGLWLVHRRAGGMKDVAPFATAADEPVAITLRGAVLMTLRNEDPERALARLAVVKDSLDETPDAASFGYYVLSDTSDPAIAAREERAVAAWRRASPRPERIVYRRRSENTGFKAGNLRDFCETFGRDHDVMIPLDADSLMSGREIVRMMRIMQAWPQIGILQSLVVGAPSKSAFARIFQFGMRQGMRPYAMGMAWWSGDCGPYWGHNALVRIKPFREHCRLPVLPGGSPLSGHVMSHDQVEAVLMRRAGYEVRLLPTEGGSYEENPPTILDFSARDLRWCLGNMQYLRLLRLPRILPTSRFQLIWAVAMFVGVPAGTLMLALLPLFAQNLDMERFALGGGIALIAAFLLMANGPKLAGLVDVALKPGEVARYGGRARLFLGGIVEFVFSLLLGAVTGFRLTLFMLALPFGKRIAWNGQARDAHGISWSQALREFWPPTLFGLALCAWLYSASPPLFYWTLPWTIGYLTAVPFAVLTASPAVGAHTARLGICAVPEDIAPPAEIARLETAAALDHEGLARHEGLGTHRMRA
jgi:membrane glycosyltransferase